MKPEEEKVQEVFLKVLKGLQELWGLGFVHRDIKPENIVLDETNSELRIVDFDSCLRLEETNFNGPRGTHGYMASDVSWSPGSKLWDLWALASSILEAFAGVEVYNEIQETKQVKELA